MANEIQAYFDSPSALYFYKKLKSAYRTGGFISTYDTYYTS